jgi:hypothetical protein
MSTDYTVEAGEQGGLGCLGLCRAGYEGVWYLWEVLGMLGGLRDSALDDCVMANAIFLVL